MWGSEPMNDKNILPAVIKTLETISVSGKDNLGKLLGCISALESLFVESAEKEEQHGG